MTRENVYAVVTDLNGNVLQTIIVKDARSQGKDRLSRAIMRVLKENFATKEDESGKA